MNIVSKIGINSKKDQLIQILKEKAIKPVYHPIISLSDGSIYGYEALSRITLEGCSFNIGDAFLLADKYGVLWALEKLCRTKSLKMAANKPSKTKLFLNVDPNIIHDPDFQMGLTKERLEKLSLSSDDIVFEATERSAITDMNTFKSSLKHYREQGFSIAVDDVGSGYSGMNRIFSVTPQFIKIDMEIVRDIHKDEYKRSLLSGISKFANDVGVNIIAEGVENSKELETLIKLGIHYAQGFYWCKPSKDFLQLNDKQVEEIKNFKHESLNKSYNPNFFGNINSLCKIKNCVLPNEKLIHIFELMEKDASITEVIVVDKNNKFLGVLTKRFVFECFSGRFGFNLNIRKTAMDYMDTKCLTVDSSSSIETVSRIAMSRKTEEVYDAIIVVDNNEFVGVATVKDLLNAAINIQVKRATECNPLTGLPGNVSIEEKIGELLSNKDSFTAIYLDLDNFKAYNDSYGFNNGDLMIKAVAHAMKECCEETDFNGHIGGDDFVIITHDHNVDNLCHNIISKFKKYIKHLYSESDWKNGYIVSKNRNGFLENFPISSLSIAAITNKYCSYNSLNEFSLAIANAKKKSKNINGNSVVII